MEKINFFNRLERLLFQLDSHLEAVSLPCVNCIDCCVDLKDSSIFAPLYIDYINYNLSTAPDNNYPLLSWEEGLEVSLCPYLDVINSRCNIYKLRPCTCRIYPVLLFKNPELLYNECVFTSYDFASLRNSDLYDKINLITNQISELNLNYLIKCVDKFRLEKYKYVYCNRLPLTKKANRDIKLYTSAVLLNEKSSSLHYCLARNYMNIKENELALKEVDKIINLYETNIKARLLRASLYNSMKRVDEAICELEKSYGIESFKYTIILYACNYLSVTEKLR